MQANGIYSYRAFRARKRGRVERDTALLWSLLQNAWRDVKTSEYTDLRDLTAPNRLRENKIIY